MLFVSLAVVLFVLVGSVSLTAIYFWFFEPPYLSYRDLPFKTQSESVRVGEVMPLRVFRCSSASKTRVYGIAHKLVPLSPGLEVVVMESRFSSIEPGCAATISMINRIPPETKPGRYYIDGVAEVSGTVATFIVPWESVPFEVIP